MNEKLIIRKNIFSDEGFLSEMELSYYIIEKLSGTSTFYGVRIVKKTIENGAHICEDNSSDCIFSDATEIAEFINILIRYEVTPLSLDTVLSDYFSLTA